MNENLTSISISERLRYKIKELKKTQTQISREIEISKNAMSNYINGNRIPDTMTCLKLSKALGVTMEWILTGEKNFNDSTSENTTNENLTSDERLLLQYYKDLTEQEKDEILGRVTRMVSGSIFTKTTQAIHDEEQKQLINVRVYSLAASAGLGNYLDEYEAYDMIGFDTDKIPHKADFGIRISGDSMEPDIRNSSIVWVKQQIQVDNGDIGIFILNGEAFCKKLNIDHKMRKVTLVSLNKKYRPIVIAEHDDLRTVGKVLM